MTDTRLGRLQTGVSAASLLRHAPVALLGGLYLYAIGLKAARTPLWYDEIVTYHVSALGGPAAIVGYLQARRELEAIAAGARDPMNQGTANAARIIAIVVGVMFAVAAIGIMLLVLVGGGLAFLGEMGRS